MQSLSRLESQRIAAVLQRATIDVSNLRYVPDKPDQSLRDLMRDIGGDAGEVGAMLYSFWQLEEGRLVMQSGMVSSHLRVAVVCHSQRAAACRRRLHRAGGSA